MEHKTLDPKPWHPRLFLLLEHALNDVQFELDSARSRQ